MKIFEKFKELPLGHVVTVVWGVVAITQIVKGKK